MVKEKTEFTGWHVSIAAESIAAGQFARLGYDVSVQYGANQKEYDLIIAKGQIIIKISVKGSKDGGWGLTQNLLTKGKADYHDAAKKWLEKHGHRTIFCFVQFKDVAIEMLPRIYLATPKEIYKYLVSSREGKGDTIIHESHNFRNGVNNNIPNTWKFSEKRLHSLTKAFSI